MALGREGIGEVVGADGLEGRLFFLDGGGGGGVEFGLGVVGLGEAEGGLLLEILAPLLAGELAFDELEVEGLVGGVGLLEVAGAVGGGAAVEVLEVLEVFVLHLEELGLGPDDDFASVDGDGVVVALEGGDALLLEGLLAFPELLLGGLALDVVVLVGVVGGEVGLGNGVGLEEVLGGRLLDHLRLLRRLHLVHGGLLHLEEGRVEGLSGLLLLLLRELLARPVQVFKLVQLENTRHLVRALRVLLRRLEPLQVVALEHQLLPLSPSVRVLFLQLLQAAQHVLPPRNVPLCHPLPQLLQELRLPFAQLHRLFCLV